MTYYEIKVTSVDARVFTINIAEEDYNEFNSCVKKDEIWTAKDGSQTFYLPKANIMHMQGTRMEPASNGEEK